MTIGVNEIIHCCEAAQREKNLEHLALNKHMNVEPIIVTAVATSQNTQSNRVETVRRQYTDNAGRVEVKETHYYYYVYDRKGQVEESTPNGSVDLRV